MYEVESAVHDGLDTLHDDRMHVQLMHPDGVDRIDDCDDIAAAIAIISATVIATTTIVAIVE